MLCLGAIVLRLKQLCSKLLCLWLPINPMPKGGDPHAKLGVMVLRVNAVVRLFSGVRSYLTLRLNLR